MHNGDTEHHRTIYCDEAGSRSMLIGGVMARSMSIEAIMGAVGDKLVWDMAGNGKGSIYGGGG